MKMPNDPDIPAAQAQQGQGTRRRGLWPWFAAGFLVVFVGMLLFVRMFSMHPSGEFVVSCSLMAVLRYRDSAGAQAFPQHRASGWQ